MIFKSWTVPESLQKESIQALLDQGWVVLTDEYSDKIVGVRSVLWHWNSMTWAERTYYGAKYGFNQHGVLEILSPEYTPSIGSFRLPWDPGQGRGIVVPEARRTGSNDRLKSLLAQGRVVVEPSGYDDTSLAHLGPDGTSVITAEYLWGLPYPNHDSYIELNERYTCAWEIAAGTWCPDAPCWAVGPTGEEFEQLT